MEKQTTLSKPVSFEGIGLHTGNKTKITFKPAPSGYRYKFIRTDISNKVEIDAIVENVIDLSRGTTLGVDGIEVHTVEHVLAALVGLNIDNCRIELEGNEPPVGDGSSKPYVDVLSEAGIEELDQEREYFEIKNNVSFVNEDKGVEIVALPNKDYRLTVMIDYANPALGSQHTGLFDFHNEFKEEFAPARTFCFLHELFDLHEAGLIRGGNLDSAVVIVDEEMDDNSLVKIKDMFNLESKPNLGKTGILNDTPLRFKNEFARHKLLDLIGDLALAGVNIKGQLLAARPGHRSNIEMAKKIRAEYLKHKELEKYNPSKNKNYTLNIEDIMRLMPHRYPFLLVDRVTDFNSESSTILAYKNVTINEPFFNGHFPHKPIMPGVLIVEAMAQVGGLAMIMRDNIDIEKKLALFLSIKNAKFRQQVVPGDQLIFEVKIVSSRMGVYTFECKAYVLGKLVTEAELQAALVNKE